MRKVLSVLFVSLLVTSVFADEFRTIRTDGKLYKSKQPAQAVQTLSAGATTASLANGLVITTGINTGATAITGFTNAIAGNIVYVVGNASTTSNATTIADSGAFKLSAAFTANANDTLVLYVRDQGDYVEIGRSDN